MINQEFDEAKQILTKEQEDEFCRAIHLRSTEAPYFNVRNIVRLIALAGHEAAERAVKDTGKW